MATSERPLHQGDLLLPERHDLGRLPEHVVRVRRRQRALLRARGRLDLDQRRHLDAVRERLRLSLDDRRAPSTSGSRTTSRRTRARYKFAFFHYPLYSDNASENTDFFLHGQDSLEGLLNRYGVDVAFTGHAHLYQRNIANAPYGLPNYTTGGGGAFPEPIANGSANCSQFDAYGIGWSDSTSLGSACGAAPVPTGRLTGVPLPQGQRERQRRCRSRRRTRSGRRSTFRPSSTRPANSDLVDHQHRLARPGPVSGEHAHLQAHGPEQRA